MVKQGRIKLPIPNGYRFERIENILFCEAIKNYTKIYMISGEKFLVAKTLKRIEEILPKPQFFRCNRQCLVNLKYVKEYHSSDCLKILFEDGSEFFLSIRRKAEFFKAMDHYLE